MKSPWNKIFPLIPITIGSLMMVVGIIYRVSGDVTGSEVVIMGSILLSMSIVAISSQRTRSKM